MGMNGVLDVGTVLLWESLVEPWERGVVRHTHKHTQSLICYIECTSRRFEALQGPYCNHLPHLSVRRRSTVLYRSFRRQ